MVKRYMDSEDRQEQRFRKLNTRKPVCVGCGESDSACLERHHIAGRKHHDDTVILCRNCHRIVSDKQLDHIPLVGPKPENELAEIVCYLLGLSDLHTLTGARLREFANSLIQNSET